jgi:hypothetical protein
MKKPFEDGNVTKEFLFVGSDSIYNKFKIKLIYIYNAINGDQLSRTIVTFQFLVQLYGLGPLACPTS